MPLALKIGVDYHTFWELNPKKLMPFISAYNEKRQEEANWADYVAWLHGSYILEAIASILPKSKVKYPTQPKSMPRSSEEEEFERKKKKLKAAVEVFNAGFKKKKDVNADG